MATFLDLKTAIASDLDREILSSEIAKSIKSAIKLHASERFWFNETRSATFTTVADENLYTLTESAILDIEEFIKVDYLKIQIGPTWREMVRISSDEMEAAHDNATSGQPHSWAYYDNKYRLYPTPNDEWTIRIAGHYRMIELDSDSDENAWTIEAQDMIEERAKAILFAKTIRDMDQAAAHNAVADMFLAKLREQTGRRTGTGILRPWY